MQNYNYKRRRRQYQSPTIKAFLCLTQIQISSVCKKYISATERNMITTSYLKAPIMLSVKLDLVDDSLHSNQCKSVHKNDVRNLFYFFHKMENHRQMPS